MVEQGQQYRVLLERQTAEQVASLASAKTILTEHQQAEVKCSGHLLAQ